MNLSRLLCLVSLLWVCIYITDIAICDQGKLNVDVYFDFMSVLLVVG